MFSIKLAELISTAYCIQVKDPYVYINNFKLGKFTNFIDMENNKEAQKSNATHN